MARLRAEVAGLRRAMRHRAMIEQAKGVMAARLGVPPEQAFDHLLRLSQDTNTKVTGVAAAVVGTATPEPASPAPEPVVAEELRIRVAEELSLRQPRRPVPPQARPPAVEALHSHHQIVGARAAAARDYDELAEALVPATPGWPQPRAVLICGLEPDGALRLLGGHGMTVVQRSQWKRMPPQLEVPVTRAVRCRAPVVANTPGEVKQEFPALADSSDPPSAALALPLTDGDEVIGSVGLSWSGPLELEAGAERYLFALAGPVGARARELAAGPESFPEFGEPWLPIPLEAMHNPAVLLSPLRTGSPVAADFRVSRANTYAQALCREAGIDLAGATLLSLFPYAGSQDLLTACREALAGTSLRHLDPVRLRPADLCGRASDSLSARIAAVADKVLLVWHPHTTAESSYEQLLRAEAVSGVGSFRRDPSDGVLHLSPYLRELLGVDDGGLSTLDTVVDKLHPADRAAARRLLAEPPAGNGDVRANQEFRGTGRLAGRSLRVGVESPGSGAGDAAMLVGTVQDVTEERLLRARMRQHDVVLAGQRRAAAARDGRAAATLPAPEPLAGPDVIADGAGTPARRSAGAHWYDAAELPGGDILLVVGHVPGEETEAVVDAGRVRQALRSYALVRQEPAEILASANALLRFDRPGLTAGVVLARYTPAGRCLRWAAAGRAAPVHFRGRDPGSVLAGTVGPPLGTDPAAAYREGTLAVRSGDRLLLHTHGLAHRPPGDRSSLLDRIVHAGARIRPEAVTALLDGAAHGDDLCVLLARFRTGSAGPTDTGSASAGSGAAGSGGAGSGGAGSGGAGSGGAGSGGAGSGAAGSGGAGRSGGTGGARRR
ncbi:SpoIIE family protein phosphatase [Plantactinospora sp. WMMB334]|uniref:SpoIIE family protein phosphatase n=1 Tax=Plantactinospora sp. WMMB334 TaxID=3404119 RepID=UPI003B95060D